MLTRPGHNPSLFLTVMALQIRTRRKALTNLYLVRFFSRSPSSDSAASQPPQADSGAETGNSAQPLQSSFSSHFSDVRARLKQQDTQQTRLTRPPSQSPPYNNSNNQQRSRVSSYEEIRKNLSGFRRRLAPPSSGSPPVSVHDLYNRNVIAKNDELNSNSNPNPNSETPVSSRVPMSSDGIRESLRRLRSSSGSRVSDKRQNDPLSLAQFKDSLRLKPDSGDMDIEGKEGLPTSLFPKGAGDKKDYDTKDTASKTHFLRTYEFSDLGKQLSNLRPEGPAEEWFSLEELNNRLAKLREMEEKETGSKFGGSVFKDLRDSLLRMHTADDAAKSSINKLDIFGQLGRTPSFMMQPPKEHLVEKYFHPDNMSSAEKLKLELAKVRDEFKLSESDCGSARVQVAQLTTKIKHLSAVLHKKDKHSRKGLVAMVQQRKKLLKYLRRTDWDSYCLVLDKLGLRDNPVLKG